MWNCFGECEGFCQKAREVGQGTVASSEKAAGATVKKFEAADGTGEGGGLRQKSSEGWGRERWPPRTEKAAGITVFMIGSRPRKKKEW